MIKIYLAMALVLIAQLGTAQELKRQALIDYSITIDDKSANPVFIKSIKESSRFYTAGLRAGDQILEINSTKVSSLLIYTRLSQKWRSDDKVQLMVNRNNQLLVLTPVPDGKPVEEIEGCDVSLDEATTKEGYAVRMIVTKPKTSTAKLPVIFFVQWLSCDQVELNRQSMDGWAYLIENLAEKTDAVLVRTEKPGLGDSKGPHCTECDLTQEINAYKASFKKMMSYDFIDKDKIIIIGGSIGGALAPVVAEGQKVKGIISTGGFSTTWYEHILDFERSRLFYSGTKAESIDSLVKEFSSFYYEYLIRKRKPSEIIKTKPSYSSLWYQQDDLQFGRPVKYYQQLQDLNMSYYWNKIECPVLVVYGEYDWIMSRAEQENIAQLLNTKKPGSCELKIIPGMNHHFSKYATAQEAFDEPDIKYEPAAFEIMKEWISRIFKN